MPTTDPALLVLDCPSCRRRLYKMRAGQWTAETRLMKLLEGRVYLKCDNCRTDVEVPWLAVVPPHGAQRVIEVRPGPTRPSARVSVARVTGSGT